MELTINLAMSQGFASRCFSLDDVCITSEVANIPRSILRRSSILSREVLGLSHFIFESGIDFLVFATKHGELNRTQKLLQSLAQKTELSPTQFAQSVHSTAAGLLTIANSKKVPFSTICASEHTFSMAVLEAVSHLKCSPGSEVCLIMADEYPPPELEEYIDRNDAGVLAIRLKSGSDFRLNYTPNNLSISSQTVRSSQQQLVDFANCISSKKSIEMVSNNFNISLVAIS
jgi:hypothetical protein